MECPNEKMNYMLILEWLLRNCPTPCPPPEGRGLKCGVLRTPPPPRGFAP